LVICRVELTEPMRLRMSRREGTRDSWFAAGD
jgi:hypothetical protein